MSATTKGVIIGISGFFAGTVAAQAVSWDTLPKAALAVAVAIGVSTAVWALLRPKASV